jgi:predicted acylesterase/phospholipase RssA
MSSLALESFGTVSLAGGGNRCWWLAGLLDVWMASGKLQPHRMLATSAGVGVATAALCGSLDASIAACQRLYSDNPRVWRGQKNAWFAQEDIYPAWVRSYVTEPGLHRLRGSGIQLWAGVTRLPSGLPLWAGVSLGIAAYVSDKYFGKNLHPKMAQRCGLRMELHSVSHQASASDVEHLLISAAAAPPFIASRRLAGRVALDGGFSDNVPRADLARGDQPHLMLLTRHYPNRPFCFNHDGRTYLQPSRRVPVSTWDCTAKTDIMSAVELGRRDGLRVMQD